MLYKFTHIQKSLATPQPSFPHTTLQVLLHLANRSTLVVRRRESMLTLNLKWIPAYTGMTAKISRLAYA